MIDGEDDELLLTDEVQDEGTQQADTGQDADDGPIELVIEGEEDGVEETPLVRKLRLRAADLARENADLRKSQQPQKIEVGVRPTIEGCDFDQDRFDQEYDAWVDRRERARRQERDQSEQQEVKSREFERLRDNHRRRGITLGIKDFDEKERALVDALGSPELAGLALRLAGDSAKLVGAIGANPTALAKLEAESDATEKLKMLLQMESRIVKKPPPPPEAGTIQRGTASVAHVDPDKELARLEKEADRTGDRTKIIAHKRAMKEKARKAA